MNFRPCDEISDEIDHAKKAFKDFERLKIQSNL